MLRSFETFVAWRYLRARGSRAGLTTMGVGLAMFVGGCILAALAKTTIQHAFSIKAEVVINQPKMIAGLICAVVGVLVLVFGAFHSLQSIFTTISTFGVFLGTAALVVALSVMNGFEVDLREKILGSNAHIQVSRKDGAFTEWRQVQQALSGVCTARHECVVGTTPFLSSEVVVAANSNYQPVVIKGIDPATITGVTDLQRSMIRAILTDEETGDLPPEGSVKWNRARKRAQRQLHEMWPLRADGGAEEGKTGTGDASEEGEPVDFSGGGGEGGPRDGSAGRGGGAEGDAQSIDAAPPDAAVAQEEEEPIDFSGEGPDGGPDVFPHRPLPPLEEPRMDPSVATLDGIVVGAELAKGLHLYPGEEVTVVSPLGRDTPTGQVPRVRSFRVAGKFLTGMYEYDTKSVYVTLPALQSFLSVGDEVNAVEVKSSDISASRALSKAISAKLGPDYKVEDWQDLNHNLFSALGLEKVAMFIILTVIILVASFSIISNLIMVVVEKAREIAILKSMGAADGSVMRVFVIEGTYIGLLGTGVGLVVGVATCLWLKYSGLPLDPDVYYIDRLPVAMDPVAIAAVALAGIAISVLATVYPSYVAARLQPVDGLRYE